MRLFIAAVMIALVWALVESMVRYWPITLGAAALLGAAAWWDLRSSRT